MEATGIFLQHLSVEGGRPSSDKLQRKLYVAIRKGDLEKVKCTLNSFKSERDLNCVRSYGKTPLQVAADLKDVPVRNDMIRTLLSGGVDFEIALLHAVHEGSVKTVEILLQFHEKQHQVSARASYSSGCSESKGYTTPLVLAAWMQNFQIVKLLLEHGFTVGCPKNPQWSSDSNGMASEKLGPAVCRLNGFRALASPVYIGASFLQDVHSGLDPIHRACVLNKELCSMAEQEYEFKKEYLELSDGCKEFAVALLNECRSMEEIRWVMEMKKEEGMLCNVKGFTMLEFAIATRNEKFVSHPYSQLIINSEVYKNVPFLEKSAWKQALLILLASVLFPLFFMVWLVFDSCFPSHKVARMFHSPRVKFLFYCGSYQTFLFLLALTSAFSDFLGYSIADWVVLLFVIGHLVDVIKDFYQQGRVRFCSNYWNYLAVATVTSFALHYVIWWAGRTALVVDLDSLEWERHGNHPSYTITLISECFLAVAILLAFVQNFSFIQANASTGPLLHAFIEMLIDVAKFFLYFIFVFLAFAVSFTKLYLQHERAEQYFDTALKENKTDRLDLASLRSNLYTIFWALFGDIDRDHFHIHDDGYGAIQMTGMWLFGAFNIVAVLVALNMLIAILNESYTRISGNLDTEWKFTRTKLWLSWIYKKGVLPPPFNVLYVLLPVLWVVKRLAKACCPDAVLLFFKKLIKEKPRKTWKIRRTDEKQRREVIRHLVLRYLAKKFCYSETGIGSSDSEEEHDGEASAAQTTNNLENSHSTQV